MKVRIGPYINWIGPYQIAGKIPFISSSTAHKIGEYLNKTFLSTVCEWIHEHRPQRKVHIRIDDYDTWNMDHTLSLIIVPMLKQLKESKPGCPYVDLEDVPENLRYTTGTDMDYYSGSFFWMERRWEWVINEMIFAHQYIIDSSDYPKMGIEDEEKLRKRVSNGLMLFGKYYQSLWD